MEIKKILIFSLEIVQIIAIALIIVIPIRYFVFQPFIVKGASMEPNYHNGDYLIIDELSYRFRDPKRGEVVVFRYPNDPEQRFIKRIVGLPGETITLQDIKLIIESAGGDSLFLDESMYLDSDVWLGDDSLTLGRDEYYVMGDNRAASFDSRKWGSLLGDDIIGRVILRAWPFTSIDFIGAPNYSVLPVTN